MKLVKCLIIVLVSVWLSLICSSTMSAAIAPLPLEAVHEEGVYIEINKKSNLLTVYVNGRANYRFSVATGRSNDLTPEGEFHIVTKIVKPWYMRKQIPGGHPRNPLGTRWLGINVPGSGGYTYGIHGTNRPYSIGSHASSGCVRMHNKDIEWLYRHIPLGTKVIIK
ncbi:L,D-transpeptidase [Paenibacillus sp. FSL H7-0331]|jgi:lipoprotein-anchoring transpeptidase ErfK/SrfK|uniref:L,D-transpeptidase n=1 Tax=Paenibacillus sp. FSL H7-0331 TaxID=1920421 RepID=UPI00096CF1FD|nr:L,D-transpeptidase [Paenibacillus sp. FSL H7-0331]OMF18262.1 L,D-transpeptidase [Paenibacillus sp. FSL H7-0331]